MIAVGNGHQVWCGDVVVCVPCHYFLKSDLLFTIHLQNIPLEYLVFATVWKCNPISVIGFVWKRTHEMRQRTRSLNASFKWWKLHRLQQVIIESHHVLSRRNRSTNCGVRGLYLNILPIYRSASAKLPIIFDFYYYPTRLFSNLTFIWIYITSLFVINWFC